MCTWVVAVIFMGICKRRRVLKEVFTRHLSIFYLHSAIFSDGRSPCVEGGKGKQQTLNLPVSKTSTDLLVELFCHTTPRQHHCIAIKQMHTNMLHHTHATIHMYSTQTAQFITLVSEYKKITVTVKDKLNAHLAQNYEDSRGKRGRNTRCSLVPELRLI